MTPRTSTIEPTRGAPPRRPRLDRPSRWGGDDGRDAGDLISRPPASAASIAVWLLVGAITILFAAFTSTFLARRAEADWRTGPLPSILWVSTILIVASSIVLEWARRRGRSGHVDQVWTGLVVTGVLGLAFLGSQVLAWRQLVSMGVYMTTNPHSAFFYLLTAMHGLHLAGGLAALGYATARTRQEPSGTKVLAVVDPTATYWHFLDGLWLYLFMILFAI